MELLGAAVAAAGVVLLLSLFTYSPGDPSLNHATGSAPHNIVGLPGAYISDLLLQTFGLAIILVPVAMITWGVRMARTHHLGFFGLRLSLLLLAPDDERGLRRPGRCRRCGHPCRPGRAGRPGAGRPLPRDRADPFERRQPPLIEPACAALAFIAMAPALGMNRTDLPLIFRILRAPFLWGVWLVRAAVGLWRGKPQPLEES